VLVSQLGTNATDSLDYWAYWKTFDMAAAAAFSGKDAQTLRNDPNFTDMSRWSDGWPVKRLSAIDPPPAAAPAKAAPPSTKAPVSRGPRRSGPAAAQGTVPR
jgi:hypothetical protein